MANKKYFESRIPVLREIRQARNKDMLVQEVVRMSKQVNQRLYRLEKKGITTESYAWTKAQEETGKDKPRYSVNPEKLSKMSIEKLYEESLKLNQKITTPTSTIQGVVQVRENRLQKASNTISDRLGRDVTSDNLKHFFELGGSTFMNSSYIDSSQLIEDFLVYTKKGRVSEKQFMAELARYKKRIEKGKSFKYSAIQKNMKNIALRKIKKKTGK